MSGIIEVAIPEVEGLEEAFAEDTTECCNSGNLGVPH